MRYYYVIGYDSKSMKWWVESDTTTYFPDGNVWDDEQHNWIVLSDDSPEKTLDTDLFSTLQSCITEVTLNHRLSAALAAAWQSVIDATDQDKTNEEG
jgi:hypothetical protein